VGKKYLEIAMKQFQGVNFKVDWQPFFLSPEGTLPEEGVPINDYLEEKYGKRNVNTRLIDIGKKVGINFTEERNIYPTLKSHCLVNIAKSQNKSDEVIEALFHSYFEEGKNINDTDFLLSLGEQCGLQNLDLNLLSSQVDTVKGEAIGWNYNIGGVPYFMIKKPGKKTYTLEGAQPPEAFVSIFKQLNK